MAFRKKATLILQQDPDILIVPECEHPDKYDKSILGEKLSDVLWYGKNSNKGLGIFSFNAITLNVLDTHEEKFRMVVPIIAASRNFEFLLYAIWANNPNDREGRYVTQIWKAINHYDSLLTSKQTILIGDFNSNTIWDRPRRIGNHSTVVEYLRTKDIHSVYHQYFKQDQGKEQHPTLYMYRSKEKPYHIDYCFASKKMLRSLTAVEVGDFEYWCRYSDHVPVIVTFDTSFLQ